MTAPAASPPPKVFVSYSHDSPEHADRVLALADRLRGDGIDATIDRYVVSPPEGWPRWIERQIRESDFVLMVCTPAYYRRVTGKETPGTGLGVTWEGNLIYQHFYSGGALNEKFIPVLLEGGGPGDIPDPFKGFTPHQPQTDPGYRALYRHLTGQPETPAPELGSRRQLATRTRLWNASVQAPGRVATLFTVPYPRNPHFTGRATHLKALHEALTRHKSPAVIQALHGMGGVGKTQLAAEYAYFHREQQPDEDVLWVRAESNAIAGEFARLALTLGLLRKPSKDAAADARMALRALSEPISRLLILDNADGEDSILPWLPTGGGCKTIITSRFASWSVAEELVSVDVLKPENARQFLLRRCRLEENAETGPAADRVGKELGYLPLALVQAAAFIDETKTSFERYLEYYGEARSRRELMARRVPGATLYPDSVAVTWLATMQRLSSLACSILSFSAFVAPDAIPRTLLSGAGDLLREGIRPSVDGRVAKEVTPYELDEALGQLKRYSMISLREQDYSVHRLMQAVVRDGLDEQGQRSWAERAVRAVSKAFPWPKYSNRDECEELLPHARVAAALVQRWGFTSAYIGDLLNSTGSYLDDLAAYYAEAESLYLQAIAVRRASKSEGHPDFASSLRNLAILYWNQGRHAEAEPLLRQAQEVWQASLEQGHPDSARTLNSLGVLNYAQGRTSEAETLYLRALEATRASLGAGHPEFALILNNLAVLYRDQGRYAEAEPLLRQALEVRRASLGEDHPAYALSLNNLAELYWRQRRYAEAEPLYSHALEVTRASRGAGHPDFAISLHNLAVLYRDQGRYAEAEPLLRQALEVRRASLGEDHPEFVQNLQILASLYIAQGRHAESEPVRQQAAEIRREAASKPTPDGPRE